MMANAFITLRGNGDGGIQKRGEPWGKMEKTVRRGGKKGIDKRATPLSVRERQADRRE
jgi:hypothetical protein